MEKSTEKHFHSHTAAPPQLKHKKTYGFKFSPEASCCSNFQPFFCLFPLSLSFALFLCLVAFCTTRKKVENIWCMRLTMSARVGAGVRVRACLYVYMHCSQLSVVNYMKMLSCIFFCCPEFCVCLPIALFFHHHPNPSSQWSHTLAYRRFKE